MNSPKTYGLTHLAIAVKDVNRTRQFYNVVFDMHVMYFEKGFLQMTTPGSMTSLYSRKTKRSPQAIPVASHILASV